MQHQFKITGMTCTMCASNIAAGLRKVDRVEFAAVDYATQTALVDGDVPVDEVIHKIDSLGYKAIVTNHGKDSIENTVARKFWTNQLIFGAVISIVIMVLSMGPQEWHFSQSAYVQAVLSAVFIAFPGRNFVIHAYGQLKSLSFGMDSLVAIGMLSSWIGSALLMMQGHSHLYFESAVMIGFFVLLGKTLEDHSREKSVQDVQNLVNLRPKNVWILSNDQRPMEVSADSLKVGSLVYLRPGDLLAADGELVDDLMESNEAAITGESKPVVRGKGERILSGSVNIGQKVAIIKVTHIGIDANLNRMIEMISQAKQSRPKIQLIVDKVSAVFVPVVIGLSVITGLVWYFTLNIGIENSLQNAISVLVISCPCALGLATPLAWVAAIGQAAKKGILLKNFDSLESLARADCVVFDKTGTLTEGVPKVKQSLWSSEFNEEKRIPLALVCLIQSSHPLARSSYQFYMTQLSTAKAVPHSDLENQIGQNRADKKLEFKSKLLNNIPGQGFSGTILNSAGEIIHHYKVGKIDYCLSADRIPSAWRSLLLQSKYSHMSLSVDDAPLAILTLKDELRDGSAELINSLGSLGMKVIVASGDHIGAVNDILESISTKIEIRAELKPEDKLKLIHDLQDDKKIVAFVGDGFNDAPALAAADVGIAMASGTDIAAVSAGIILKRFGIQPIFECILLAQRTTSIVRQNLFMAFVYNVAAIPLAMSGNLTPMIAASAMALSSLTVALNASRLVSSK
ncbi:MAG: cation-translocating P-type ATPase [Proteobacteria bacterium]|nr:cation-translocating P-type ATPase [Pseudomonadota bacterium]